MRSAWQLWLVAMLVSNLATAPVQADEDTSSLWSRATLLDGDGGPKDALRRHGISTEVWLSQYYQGMASGTGPHDFEYGGKVDAFVTLDGAKLGLWQGLYVNIHQEWIYGDDVNNRGGTLLPVNTALALPNIGGFEHDTSIIVTQIFSEQVSLTAGKFNMQDVLAKVPLIGGGGVDTFMNTGLALPITGITPPYVLGANLTVKTEPAVFSFFVYDPRNAQSWDVIENPFADGTVVLGSVTVPIKPFGLSGFQVFKAAFSTQDGLDLADVPELFLPPEAEAVAGRNDGRWFLSYGFQQYLYQNADDPRQGWGIFGQVAASDGNPNPIEMSFLGGVGGSSPIPGRALDRWGIAYFRYNISDDLIDGLNTLGIQLRDEEGVEAYYNLAVTPWFRVTGDVQYISPVRKDRDDAVFLGLRSQVKF
ncbi:MAG: carbohydrate porin [Hyphomicrobium sp.]